MYIYIYSGGDNDTAMIFMVHRVKLPRKLKAIEREKDGKNRAGNDEKKSGVIFMIAIIIRHMCKIQH